MKALKNVMKGKKKTNINKQWSWAKEAWSGESEDESDSETVTAPLHNGTNPPGAGELHQQRSGAASGSTSFLHQLQQPKTSPTTNLLGQLNNNLLYPALSESPLTELTRGDVKFLERQLEPPPVTYSTPPHYSAVQDEVCTLQAHSHFQPKPCPPTPNHHSQMKKPGYFSGRRDDWIPYRKSFYHFAKSTGIPDQDIASTLLSYLQPNEFVKVDALRLTKDELEDMESAFTRMDKVLATPYSKMGSILSLNGITQDDGSVTVFAERIRAHLNRYQQCASTFNDMALQQFLNGLDSDQIATYIIQQKVESFEIAVEMAVEWSLARAARSATSGRRQQRATQNEVFAIRESQAEVHEKSYNKLLARIDQLEGQLTEMSSAQRARSNSNGGQRNIGNGGNRRDVQCYRCQGYGHYRSDCRTKMNFQQNGQPGQQQNFSNQQHQSFDVHRQQLFNGQQQQQRQPQSMMQQPAMGPTSTQQNTQLNLQGGLQG